MGSSYHRPDLKRADFMPPRPGVAPKRRFTWNLFFTIWALNHQRLHEESIWIRTRCFSCFTYLVFIFSFFIYFYPSARVFSLKLNKRSKRLTKKKKKKNILIAFYFLNCLWLLTGGLICLNIFYGVQECVLFLIITVKDVLRVI